MTSPELAVARSFEEARMTSTCTITRPGPPVTDRDTGEVTSPGDTVYVGKCRIRMAQPWGRQAVIAGETVTPDTFQLSVPLSVVGVKRGDLVHIDTGPDPDAVGRTWYVRFTPDLGDSVTARRLLCEEQSP